MSALIIDAEVDVNCSECGKAFSVMKVWYEIRNSPDVTCDVCSDGPISFSFDIMKFENLPAWIKWAYGKVCNEEESYNVFETVDDVAFEMDYSGFLGAVLSDGGWVVHEDIELVHWEIIFLSERLRFGEGSLYPDCPKCGSICGIDR